MIDDCEAGNIDMIITKSISRFARNTLDCLKYIRKLKEKNIPISVISDSMGHNSEKITRIYLKSINDDVIDRYNDMLIEAISI